MISLLLHGLNKDIIQMHQGYNWLISQKTVPINGSFVKQQAMASAWLYSPIKASFLH